MELLDLVLWLAFFTVSFGILAGIADKARKNNFEGYKDEE